MRALRDYQEEACDATRAAWREENSRPAVVMATGLGKTSVIGKLATEEAAAGGRAMLVAHREELLGQMRRTCQEFAPSIPIDWIQGPRGYHKRPISVAMIQSLSAKRLEKIERPTLLIVDEAHHAAAAGYRRVLEWADEQGPVRALGVTATMTRAPGRGPNLGDVWSSVVYERGITWAIEHGWLVRPRGVAVVTDHMDLNSAKVRRGDFTDDELGEMVTQDVDQIVAAWIEHAHDRITAAFTPSVESANDLADAFESAGVKAEVVTGKTGTNERRGIYERLATGVTRVLCGVMVTTEGWDCPPVSCILMARPTQLPGLYQQIIGRGLRPSPETGKLDCLVLDVVGTTRGKHLQTLINLVPGSEYADPEAEICEECGQPRPCECPPEEREDGPGRRKIDTAQYREVDLLAAARASGFNWQKTDAGTLFCASDPYYLILWHSTDGTWDAGWFTKRGRAAGAWLITGVTYERAKDYIEQHQVAGPAAGKTHESWRKSRRAPTAKQIKQAAGLGIERPEACTSAELWDKTEGVLASRRIDVYT